MSDLFIFQNALREFFRPRRFAPALLVLFLPSALGLLWRLLAPKESFVPEEVYDSLVTALIFGFSLTLLSVLNGTGVVSQELEQRTIVYLLTRPVPRWRLLSVKFAAYFVIVATTTILSTLLLALVLFGAGNFGKAGVVPDLRALLIGTLTYGSLFLLIATLVNRPLTYGLLFVFGWESWVPTLPGGFARISIMTYLRILAARDINPAATPSQDSGNIFAQFSSPPKVDVTVPQAWMILAAITVVALGLAIYAFSTREYAPREDEA